MQRFRPEFPTIQRVIAAGIGPDQRAACWVDWDGGGPHDENQPYAANRSFGRCFQRND